MKLQKVKVVGIDHVTFNDKETSKKSEMYKYYFIAEQCNTMGNVVGMAYARSLIRDEYIPVIKIDGKYKIVELE